jgi:hypothetical protein
LMLTPSELVLILCQRTDLGNCLVHAIANGRSDLFEFIRLFANRVRSVCPDSGRPSIGGRPCRSAA